MSHDILQVATPTPQVVYESTSYDSFDRLTYNRNYTPERITKVRKSIKKVGQKEPGIVTTEGKIISGQARFKACEELNIPYKFIVENPGNDKDTLETMLEIHAVQSTFTLTECLDTYCSLAQAGNDRYNDYLWFKELKVKYSLAPQTLLMIIANGWDADKKVEEEFRNGRLEVDTTERNQVEYFCELMTKIDDARPFQTKNRIGATKQVFIKPMLDFVNSTHFNEERFMEQVNSNRLRLEVNTELQWEEIRYLYNRGMKPASRVKLPYTIKQLRGSSTLLNKFV
jgi:hypothetical protein